MFMHSLEARYTIRWWACSAHSAEIRVAESTYEMKESISHRFRSFGSLTEMISHICARTYALHIWLSERVHVRTRCPGCYNFVTERLADKNTTSSSGCIIPRKRRPRPSRSTVGKSFFFSDYKLAFSEHNDSQHDVYYGRMFLHTLGARYTISWWKYSAHNTGNTVKEYKWNGRQHYSPFAQLP